MIKEKLMEALKKAAEDYNGGMGASAAVAKAAEASDFNEKQAERLTEMFNTALALNKQKDSVDPTGSCELASKEAVAKLLLDGCGSQKAASAESAADYSFYGSSPERTNPTIEARLSGASGMAKAASAGEDPVPEELNVSQSSLCRIISGQIDLLKSAAAAADDVARQARISAESESIKVAKAIEDPYADPELADLFKAACASTRAVANVAEYSTKVAESDGGLFAKLNVFDASKVERLLKSAEEIEASFGMIDEYEKKRDFYLSKAAEAEDEMLRAVGLRQENREASLADMFRGVAKQASGKEPEDDPAAASKDPASSDASVCLKIASLLRESGVDSEEVARLADELEKDAAFNFGIGIPVNSAKDLHSELSKQVGLDSEQMMVNNVKRSVILADLMTNDPIIRDADPNTVTEAYKTMVMSAPRVSLDKSQVRAFLRSAVNSVAISPADAKVIGDVDKLTALANTDRLTRLDSSIKDSNV